MTDTVKIGPVERADRIEVIDVMRGVAILGILHLNMPLALNPAFEVFSDIRIIGWGPLDQWAWMGQHIFTEGTMRGLLQLLLGVGLMLLASKAMSAKGPVGVADVWYRRNLWLLVFGAFNGMVLLWPGDILFPYALAAIFIFPFRLLRARWLFAIGLAFLAWTVIAGVQKYEEAADFVAGVEEARVVEQAGEELSQTQSAALAEWDRRLVEQNGNPFFAKESPRLRKAQAEPLSYIEKFSQEWFGLFKVGQIQEWVIYSFFIMLIGMALYKVGFVQGALSTRLYLAVMVSGYAFGWGIRYWEAQALLTFEPLPNPADPFGDIPRLAIAIAHIALVNVLMRTRAARALGASLGAVGKIAFTIYLTQSFILTYIVAAPWGLSLYGDVGWFQVVWMSALIMALQTVLAMWWLSRFRFGPLEWLWRSLTHWQRQPMRLSQDERVQPAGYGPQAAE
ncbi:MAG: DUF418 domain-containing protein [Pseudomonadota bacterium]